MKMMFMGYKTIPQGTKFVRDIFSTFNDPVMAGNIGIEQGWQQLTEKSDLGTKSFGNGRAFLSLSYGEYAVVRCGFANVVLALTDKTEQGIKRDDLVRQTAEMIIQQTNGYYFDAITHKPKPYIYKMVNQTIDELKKYNLLDMKNDKYYWAYVDPIEFLAYVYGSRLNHSTGLSSFSRMMMIALVGYEPGIGADFITERLKEQHRVDTLKDSTYDKMIAVHGVNGTGYVLLSRDARLYRAYDRLDQSQRHALSVLEEKPNVLKAIIEIPCISEDLIYELFGSEVVRRLREETSTLQPNFASSIVIRRGSIYFLGAQLKALELRNCTPEKSPVLSLIGDLYRKFTPADCYWVASRARDIAHILHSEGEFKPETDNERRMILFLLNRGLVEQDPTKADVYRNNNDVLIKNLSILLGNVLECGRLIKQPHSQLQPQPVTT